MIPALSPYRGGGGGDPYFSDVVVLLHFDGANGATTTVDSSGSPKTIALVSSTLSSAEAAFGPTSLLPAPATSAYAFVASGLTSLGNGEWTFEVWVYPTSNAASYVVNYNTTNTSSPITIIFTAGGDVRVQGADFGGSIVFSLTSAAAIPLNAWTFIQARRTNGVGGSDVIDFAINGVAEAATQALTAGDSLYPAASMTVGGTGGTTLDFPGFVDEFRFTQGVARAFNLPTAAFPNF